MLTETADWQGALRRKCVVKITDFGLKAKHKTVKTMEAKETPLGDAVCQPVAGAFLNQTLGTASRLSFQT